MQHLLPAVYVIKKTNEGVYFCVPESERLNTKPKLYGRMKNDVVRIWNNYVYSVRDGKGGTGAIFVGYKGSGKALKNGTLLRTLNGWKAIEEHKIGDIVETPDGRFSNVLGVYPQGIVDLYKVTFEDGRSIIACEEHLWKVYNMDMKGKFDIVNTKYIIEAMRYTNKHCKLYIDLPEPVFYSSKEGPSYMDVVNDIKHDKCTHLDSSILKGEITRREFFIRHLLNDYSDSKLMHGGEITVLHKELANDITYVVRSLGGMCKMTVNENNTYALKIWFNGPYGKKLRIIDVIQVEPGEATCIEIGHPDHLYIAEDFIVTHNTEAAYNVANLGIDNGLPVIKVVNIKADIGLISFIASLGSCVLIFDEFAKNFERELQDKMLTLLSDRNLGVRLSLVTENEARQLSNYIIGRPGRFLEMLNYSRVDRSVIDEYCAEYEVTPEFYNDLIACYNKSVVFSFDYLETFVTQHKRYPNETVETMLTYLNVELGTLDRYYYVHKVETIALNEDGVNIVYEIDDIEISKESFERGNHCWISTNKPKRESFRITKDDVVSVLEDEVILESNGYRVTLTKNKREREKTNVKTDETKSAANGQIQPAFFI